MAIKGDGIGQHQHHQDRDQPAEAGADREKQHPGADSGAKQAQGPWCQIYAVTKGLSGWMQCSQSYSYPVLTYVLN